MTKYQENSEFCMKKAVDVSHVQVFLIMYLTKALIWALLDIADAIRGKDGR